MSLSTKGLNQTAVYWAKSSKDSFGKWSFSDPVEISCRWEEKQELYIGADNKEHTSRAKVMVDRDMAVEDMFYLGDLDDISSAEEGNPRTIDGCYDVKSFSKIPDIKGTNFRRKVYL